VPEAEPWRAGNRRLDSHSRASSSGGVEFLGRQVTGIQGQRTPAYRASDRWRSRSRSVGLIRSDLPEGQTVDDATPAGGRPPIQATCASTSIGPRSV
jgi:hypothetical protein